MKKIKFSNRKPTKPGRYLVKTGSDHSCIFLVTITGEDDELSVNHSIYYNFAESQSLEEFHSEGLDSKPRKGRKDDLWSERLDLGEPLEE